MKTIRSVTKTVFPFIKPNTIFQWMTAGVFRPEVYVAPPCGPGRGCVLSESDQVVVGILHTLFSHGVRFNDVSVHGGGGGQQMKKTPIVFENFQPLSDRPMQEYIEHQEFYCFADCVLDWAHGSRLPRRLIRFMPESLFLSEAEDYLGPGPCESHLFVSARRWLEFVKNAQ